ncbi:MAG: tRNA (N6-isopentenyl adenosine(37)-C2)-methylthiotransferase MiaB [Planctomycetota bacterium]|nr:tRNA (N6-isopentenyl adenosine(37)-C2)-methylthiotransferase MiaB [Planctomycetota bacterium]
MKVYLETMGCQMNVLDSELICSLLRQAGMEMVDDARSADVLLYNTCSVRDRAENKVHSRLGWACRHKADGVKVIIGVLGCMAQRQGQDLIKQHRGVDIVAGPGQIARLTDMIHSAAAGAGPQIALDSPRSKTKADDEVEFLDQIRDPSQHHLPRQAYVRIMRGCDNFCSYCIVPYVRGPERSRPPEDILEEVRRLADAGVTQVTLLGQTVNSYRSGGVSLADLLARLDSVVGLRRIRFVTSYPGSFDRAIFQAMRALPKVCEFLHIPAQSGSDRVLRAMNRHYSRGEYDDLIAAARQTVPGVAIVGDFIVGFPGETEEDFAASADLVRRSEYKNSYIFKYSPRPGTAADKRLTDDVNEQTKRRRNRELLAVQSEVSLTGNRTIIGQSVEVLVEGPSPRADKQSKKGGTACLQAVLHGIRKEHRLQATCATPRTQLVGRTRTDHIVVFDGPENLAGQYTNVKITDATALTLFGQL